MENQYCVIGHPVAHSLSPAIYNALFEMYDIDAKYTCQDVTPEELPAFIDSLEARGIAGFNVTMPLKNEILRFLEHRDQSCRFGCNTVVRTDGSLSGYSTDADGFRQSLALHERYYRDSNVTFIGCGGAARALIQDAINQGARRVTIVNRTREHAREFMRYAQVRVLSMDDLSDAVQGCNILVNATPMGMAGVDAAFPHLAFLSWLPRNAFVADLVYNPPETEFLREAARLGHQCMNGLWMLIWVSFYSFQRFTGIFPDESAFATIRDQLEGRS